MPQSVEVAFTRPELVASDLDGTLLSSALELSDLTTAGVAALTAAGIPFVIVTGRMFRSARPMAARLGLVRGPIVCYQGAMIVDLASGERVFHQPLERDAAIGVIRYMRELRRHVNVFIDDELYVESVDEWARRYAEYAGVDIHGVSDLVVEVGRRRPTKIVVTTDIDDVAELLPRLQERWRETLYVTRSQPQYIEVCHRSVSKSGALERLRIEHGARRERTVASGDGQNDIDMLRWAALGVAVAEAAAEVRAAADLVVERARLGEVFLALARAPA
jgi:Cof subfamily protein (haloacid dehalogenase superfamily)